MTINEATPLEDAARNHAITPKSAQGTITYSHRFISFIEGADWREQNPSSGKSMQELKDEILRMKIFLEKNYSQLVDCATHLENDDNYPTRLWAGELKLLATACKEFIEPKKPWFSMKAITPSKGLCIITNRFQVRNKIQFGIAHFDWEKQEWVDANISDATEWTYFDDQLKHFRQ